MAKRMGTYRADSDLIDAAVAKAAERGETVTDLIIERLQAYIRDDEAAGITSAPPVALPPVYTPDEAPPSYEEAPERPDCRHPADRVEAGECGICHADVW